MRKSKVYANAEQKPTAQLKTNVAKSNVIYQASIIASKNTTKLYSTIRNLKTRFNEHKVSFHRGKTKNCTQLANYLWSLNEQSIKYSIKWKILKSVKNNLNHLKVCKLCNLEKLHIAQIITEKFQIIEYIMVFLITALHIPTVFFFGLRFCD